MDSQNSAFYTNKASKSKQKSHGLDEKFSSLNDSEVPVCQICKIPGHLANHCRWRYTPASKKSTKNSSKSGYDSTYSPSTSDNLQQAFHSIKLNSTNICHDHNVASCWITDSGAASHMTNDSSCLSKAKAYKGNDQVMVGDGKFFPIEQAADAILDIKNAQVHLHDVLYVPSIKENLISITHFTKDNSVSFEFFPWGYHIKDLKTKSVLAEGFVKDNLYPLTTLQASKVVVHSSSRHTSDLWHGRLCHTSTNILHKMASSAGITINTSSPQLCNSCQLGKHHRFPFYHSERTIIEPLYFIHCDLWGPAPVAST